MPACSRYEGATRGILPVYERFVVAVLAGRCLPTLFSRVWHRLAPSALDSGNLQFANPVFVRPHSGQPCPLDDPTTLFGQPEQDSLLCRHVAAVLGGSSRTLGGRGQGRGIGDGTFWEADRTESATLGRLPMPAANAPQHDWCAPARRPAPQLRLYKLVFGSVALFAEQDPTSSNEPILQPHLGGIIKTSLKVLTAQSERVRGVVRPACLTSRF